MPESCKAGCSTDNDATADPGIMAIEVSTFRTATTATLTSSEKEDICFSQPLDESFLEIAENKEGIAW